MMPTKFSRYIEERRIELKLSKIEFAKRAKISRQTLDYILNLDRNNLQQLTIYRLAVALEVHSLSLLRLLGVQPESQKPKYANDYSGFIGETIPDNSLMMIDQEFIKTWELVNLGSQVWKNRFLECQDDADTSKGLLIPKERKILIPVTHPEEKVSISVHFTAPAVPCTVYSYWKMIDEYSNLCFPTLSPAYCLIKVIGF